MTTPNLTVKKSNSMLVKPLEADFRELFKALGKGLSHTAIGKWDELGSDAVDALAALGLTSDAGEVMYLLLRRSAIRAIFDLLGETVKPHMLSLKNLSSDIQDKLDYSLTRHDTQIDAKFFDRPASIPFVQDLQSLLREWLILVGFESHTSDAVVNRLPSYFIYALNREWRSNSKAYRSLVDAVDTPFTLAGEREWAWKTYGALLQRRAEEGVFDEPFSLVQIYVPLRAYHAEDGKDGADFSEDVPEVRNRRRKVVVDLEEELLGWLENPSRYDAIRILSGGPGSGKSSFARIFAARVAQNSRIKVLFVPLHLIDPSRDLTDEVGRFVADEGVLLQNPLDPDSPETNLLILFDGLDELANQGKAATETARAFVREIERTIEKRNAHEVRLRVLLSG
ncbi:MAG TPA: NACHT domain-containing protein, partial [Longimicrobium sp.]|nr:NACHT domain-containing protein [Longimicrobium sp.]